ncbi:uncharacterized protein LOC128900602 [Rissa tridactyla]|uniref:uncharacterized protein LOC128900602 n=1 Tax=Rissa tridactyla TaxID=75485 RepID=UPI0023BAA080|nr:uncharacterized protein LOC128900602 [Rissa tridactyla]
MLHPGCAAPAWGRTGCLPGPWQSQRSPTAASSSRAKVSIQHAHSRQPGDIQHVSDPLQHGDDQYASVQRGHSVVSVQRSHHSGISTTFIQPNHGISLRDAGLDTAYDTFNRPSYNNASRSTYAIASRSTYDIASRSTYDIPIQHDRSTYDITSHSTYDIASRSTYDITSHSTYDIASRSTYDIASRSTYDIPIQHDRSTDSVPPSRAQLPGHQASFQIDSSAGPILARPPQPHSCSQLSCAHGEPRTQRHPGHQLQNDTGQHHQHRV